MHIYIYIRTYTHIYIYIYTHMSFGFYSLAASLQKLPLREAPSAILPRVLLVVFFASAFRGCFREGFLAEFRDLLPRKGFEDYGTLKVPAHALLG